MNDEEIARALRELATMQRAFFDAMERRRTATDIEEKAYDRLLSAVDALRNDRVLTEARLTKLEGALLSANEGKSLATQERLVGVGAKWKMAMMVMAGAGAAASQLMAAGIEWIKHK